MTILFVGNTSADFTGTVVQLVDRSSNMTTSFNSVRSTGFSPNFLRAQADPDAGYVFSAPHLAPVGDYWLHFRIQVPGAINGTGADGHLVHVFDANNAIVGGIDVEDGTLRARAAGVFGTGMATASFAVYAVDLQIIVTGTQITTNLHINGTQVSTATVASTLGKPVLTSFTNNDLSSGAPQFDTRFAAYSEFIITDDEPTLGWRLATLEPVAAGHHTALDGVVSGLLTNGDGQSLTGEIGEKASWTISAYNGPSSPAGGIRAVIAKTKSNKGFVGPQNVRPFLRIAGTDYEASNITPNAALSGEQAVFDVNPATGLPWTTAELAGIEQGIEVRP